MIASSVKEDNKLKVGRFGLGFKSVFHMTGMLQEVYDETNKWIPNMQFFSCGDFISALSAITWHRRTKIH